MEIIAIVTPWPTAGERFSGCPLNRKLAGFQKQSGCFVEDMNLFHLSNNRPSAPHSSVPTQVAIPTELFGSNCSITYHHAGLLPPRAKDATVWPAETFVRLRPSLYIRVASDVIRRASLRLDSLFLLLWSSASFHSTDHYKTYECPLCLTTKIVTSHRNLMDFQCS